MILCDMIDTRFVNIVSFCCYCFSIRQSNFLAVHNMFLFLTGSCVTGAIDNLPQNSSEHMFNNPSTQNTMPSLD